jgi:hypothetical protein
MVLLINVWVSVVPTRVPFGAVKEVPQELDPLYTAIPAEEGHIMLSPPPAIAAHPLPEYRQIASELPPPEHVPRAVASVKMNTCPVRGVPGGLANVASGIRTRPAEKLL